MYGFDVEPDGERKAWRTLVDGDGEEIIDKEYAAHCSEPADGVGLMVAHFLDGSEVEIPGMLHTLKRKAADTSRQSLKKPASKSLDADSDESDREQGEEELPRVYDPEMETEDREHGEEKLPDVYVPEMETEDRKHDEAELQTEPEDQEQGKEELCVDDALVGKHVMTQHLMADDLNGLVFTVKGKRKDGRFLIAGLDAGPTYFIKESNLRVMTARELCPFLQKWVHIGGVYYCIKAASRSTRTPAVLVKIGDKQLGQVVPQGGEAADLARAFSIARLIMCDLYDAFEKDGKEVTKTAFYDKRAELLAK